MFAFNATTGKKYWDKEILLNKGHGTFEIQPQVADGRVYLANQYGSGSGGGVLLALNAPNGRCCGSSTRSATPKEASTRLAQARTVPGRDRS